MEQIREKITPTEIDIGDYIYEFVKPLLSDNYSKEKKGILYALIIKDIIAKLGKRTIDLQKVVVKSAQPGPNEYTITLYPKNGFPKYGHNIDKTNSLASFYIQKDGDKLSITAANADKQLFKIDGNKDGFTNSIKINLPDVLLRKLMRAGYVLNDSEESIMYYLLKENIEAILGKYEFDNDEIDILTVNGVYEINSIFDKKVLITPIRQADNVTIKGSVDAHDAFVIEKNGQSINNTLNIDVNGILNQRVYKVDRQSEIYTMCDGVVGEQLNEYELDYVVQLNPVHARTSRNTEYFCLDIIKPSKPKTKKIKDLFRKNQGFPYFIDIKLREELGDSIFSSDLIFDNLKDVIKRLKQKQQQKTMNLKVPNEE